MAKGVFTLPYVVKVKLRKTTGRDTVPVVPGGQRIILAIRKLEGYAYCLLRYHETTNA